MIVRTQGREEAETNTYNVVANNVVVAFFGEELDRKASDIANGVGTTSLTTSGAETKEDWCFLSNSVQELGTGQVGYIFVGDFEFTPSSDRLGMYNSMQRLGN